MCDSPFYKKPRGYLKYLELPCGRCPACKRKRVNNWVIRLEQEERVSSSAHFVTLTYDTKHVPISNNGWMTLNKKDFQDFMKRLRKLEPNKLKYYACGEYGDVTNRPHFHIILFNCTDIENINKAWNKGSIHAGGVTARSIAYCCKYINKQASSYKPRDDRLKEFSLMSKGLGKSYLENKANVAWHKNDIDRTYFVKEGGHKVGLPRYYREKIYTEEERDYQRLRMLERKGRDTKKLKKELERKYGKKVDILTEEYKRKIARLRNFNKNQKLRDEKKFDGKRISKFRF